MLDQSTKHSALESLRSGQPVWALGIRGSRTADIVRMAKGAGFAAVWVDLEHSGISIDCALNMLAAAGDLGIEGWVRTPERDVGCIGRLLDGGACGIIMPHVESVQGAQRLVLAARFPPRGTRSQIGLLPQFNFKRLAARELVGAADAITSVHVLIESRAGVDAAEAIASLDGIDILHVGLNDLSADLGVLGEVRNPRVIEACRHVIAAASAHGKVAAVGGASDPGHYQELLSIGFAPVIFAGIDTDLLAGAIDRRVADWRVLLSTP